jgi:selenocysteine-specific elongation factor
MNKANYLGDLGGNASEQPLQTTPHRDRTQFVIGLAGHIDHGKSALVQALTGGKVDRLPEEQRRGITIELGFAHFDDYGKRFALIDVPGHERFIHTMVAGASGVDAALLVVAADDSVMPQTREHLAVLELLGVERGVVAITKCDLADDEQLELVDLEINELVAGTFLHDAPRIRTSVANSVGIAELRGAVIQAAAASPPRSADDPVFRMPIDRAFSPAGQGAVVTGTVWRGSARVGDTLHLLSAETPVRIRRLQSQGADVDGIVAGERAAINLAGVKASAIHRGNELATPGAFQPARRHLAELRVLPDAEHGVKHRQFVRLHVGADQVTAQVLMAEREAMPGQTAFAVLRCRTPVVVEYGQPFVVRQLSPARTLGGGRILTPALPSDTRMSRCLHAAEGLANPDAMLRLAAYIDLRGETILDASSRSWVGLSPSECERAIIKLIEEKRVVRCPTPGRPVLLAAERFDRLKQRLLRHCELELERRRPAPLVPLSVIVSAMSSQASKPVLDALLDTMAADQEIVVADDRIGLPTGPKLSHRERALLDKVLAQIAAAGPTPPSLKELAEQHAHPLDELELLLQVALGAGKLVRISPQIVLARDALENLRKQLIDYFQAHATGTVSEIREHWQMTRKHAVPILGFFDERQITSRSGDARSPGPRLSVPFEAVRP